MFTLNCCSNGCFVCLLIWFVSILFWIKTTVCVLSNKIWVHTFSHRFRQAGEFRKIFSFWQILAWLFIFWLFIKRRVFQWYDLQCSSLSWEKNLALRLGSDSPYREDFLEKWRNESAIACIPWLLTDRGKQS